MRVIGRCSELEGTLGAKKDDLEMSKGVVAECIDLQAQVAFLAAELEQSKARADGLNGELSIKAAKLERAKKARMKTLAGSICVLRSEQANEVETFALKEARLEEWISGLETKVLDLNK